MAFSIRRVTDVFYAVLCAAELVFAFVFNFQIIFPEYYPKSVRALFIRTMVGFKDCMVLEPPGWLQGFIWTQPIITMPYLSVAIYAFLKGVRKCPWVRIPTIVNATMTIMLCIGVIGEYLLSDFTGYKNPCPTTTNDRLFLAAIPFTFIVIYIVMIVDMTLVAPAPAASRRADTPSKGPSSAKKKPAKKSQ